MKRNTIREVLTAGGIAVAAIMAGAATPVASGPNKAGMFPYACGLRPGMKGTVEVTK